MDVEDAAADTTRLASGDSIVGICVCNSTVAVVRVGVLLQHSRQFGEEHIHQVPGAGLMLQTYTVQRLQATLSLAGGIGKGVHTNDCSAEKDTCAGAMDAAPSAAAAAAAAAACS